MISNIHKGPVDSKTWRVARRVTATVTIVIRSRLSLATTVCVIRPGFASFHWSVLCLRMTLFYGVLTAQIYTLVFVHVFHSLY